MRLIRGFLGMMWSDGSAIAVILGAVAGTMVAMFRYLRSWVVRVTAPSIDAAEYKMVKEIRRVELKIDRLASATQRKIDKAEKTIEGLSATTSRLRDELGGHLQEIEHRFREFNIRLHDRGRDDVH